MPRDRCGRSRIDLGGRSATVLGPFQTRSGGCPGVDPGSIRGRSGPASGPIRVRSGIGPESGPRALTELRASGHRRHVDEHTSSTSNSVSTVDGTQRADLHVDSCPPLLQCRRPCQRCHLDIWGPSASSPPHEGPWQSWPPQHAPKVSVRSGKGGGHGVSHMSRRRRRQVWCLMQLPEQLANSLQHRGVQQHL